MAAETLTYVGELTVVTCWCGMRHAVPAELRRHQLRQHADGQRAEGIYCQHPDFEPEGTNHDH